jgi:hypothetical protein
MNMTNVVTRLLCKRPHAIHISSTAMTTKGDSRLFVVVDGTVRAKSNPLLSSRQTCLDVRRDAGPRSNGDENVVRFRPRGSPSRRESAWDNSIINGKSPVADLRNYERAPENVDELRHCMLVNGLATIVIIVLMVTGRWMVNSMISSWPQ